MKRVTAYLGAAVVVGAVAIAAWAQDEGLITFTKGTKIVADDVNYNFEYLNAKIDAVAEGT